MRRQNTKSLGGKMFTFVCIFKCSLHYYYYCNAFFWYSHDIQQIRSPDSKLDSLLNTSIAQKVNAYQVF